MHTCTHTCSAKHTLHCKTSRHIKSHHITLHFITSRHVITSQCLGFRVTLQFVQVSYEVKPWNVKCFYASRHLFTLLLSEICMPCSSFRVAMKLKQTFGGGVGPLSHTAPPTWGTVSKRVSSQSLDNGPFPFLITCIGFRIFWRSWLLPEAPSRTVCAPRRLLFYQVFLNISLYARCSPPGAGAEATATT